MLTGSTSFAVFTFMPLGFVAMQVICYAPPTNVLHFFHLFFLYEALRQSPEWLKLASEHEETPSTVTPVLAQVPLSRLQNLPRKVAFVATAASGPRYC